MFRWTLVGLFLVFAFLATPAAADPPTNPDVGKLTDSQKLDDILDKMKTVEAMRAELRMLEGNIKELLGLRDRLNLLEDKNKKLESDLNLLLNQVPNNRTDLQEQIRKLKQEIEALRGTPPTTPETRLKPPGPNPDQEQRIQTIENMLYNLTDTIKDIRRSTVVPLPTPPIDTNFSPGTRRLYIVNRTQDTQVVVIDGMPYSVEPNTPATPALFTTPNETVTYEAPSTRQPPKPLTIKENEYYVLTLK